MKRKVVWEYQEKGEMIEYDKETSYKIEQAFEKGETSIRSQLKDFHSGKTHDVQIDMTAMTESEINNPFAGVRRIRRNLHIQQGF